MSATTKALILNPAPLANEAAGEQGGNHLGRYGAGPIGVLEQRSRALDHEWDVERLTAFLSGLVLPGGVLLVWFIGPAWLVLPGILDGCLLLHGPVGWTPPLPLMRGLGVRTSREIVHERHAFEAIRGDVQTASLATSVRDCEDRSRFENEGGSPANPPGAKACGPVAGNDEPGATER